MVKGFLLGTVMVGAVSFRQVYEARCLKSVILGGSWLEFARLEREILVMVVGAMATWAGEMRWGDEDRHSCKLFRIKQLGRKKGADCIESLKSADLYPA